MNTRTAQYFNGDNGYARLFKLNKYGYGNQVGRNLPSTVSHIVRLSMLGAGNFYSQSCILHIKNYTINGVSYLSFTSDVALMDALEIVMEETELHYTLLVKHTQAGSPVDMEVLSTGESGFLDLYTNDKFRYQPLGTLFKPQKYDTTYTGSTMGKTNQWGKIATIKVSRTFSNYSALISMFESEGIQDNSEYRLFSLQIRQSDVMNVAPRVSLSEITSSPDKRFEMFTKTTFNEDGAIVEVWVRVNNNYSSVGYQLLNENYNNNTISVHYPLTPLLGNQPTGTLKQARGNVKKALTNSSGWSALAETENSYSVEGNKVHVTLNMKGGTTTVGTNIAVIDDNKPTKTLYVPYTTLATDGSVATGVLAIYTSGNVQLRSIPNPNHLIANFTYIM